MAPPGLGRWPIHTCHQQTPPGVKGRLHWGPGKALHPLGYKQRGSVHLQHLGRSLFPRGLHILALKPNSTVKCLIAQTGWGASQEFWKEVAGEEDISQMAQLHSPCPCLESSRCAYSSSERHPTEHPLPGEKEVAGKREMEDRTCCLGHSRAPWHLALEKHRFWKVVIKKENDVYKVPCGKGLRGEA